ncbi:MAG TPA: HdeA/HdeB family chaperone [Candidatus Bathyarchaeia archaeon]|nr:HdeA/HdeB family chaperone [Candidatus Bathyarchaeia archaeon]
MKTRKYAGVCVLTVVVGSGAFGAPVFGAQSADKTVKPETMTCEEFLALGEDVQPHVVYWIHGYSLRNRQSGGRGDPRLRATDHGGRE